MATVRRWLWVGALAFGLVMLALGSFFIAKGFDAKAQIRAALEEEQVYTSKDATNFGVAEGLLVADPVTAQAQADTIKLHTLGKWGPWNKIPSKLADGTPNPDRQTFVNGVALRTALNMAVLSFGVADLAIGTGAVVLLIGFGSLGLAVPAFYWAKEAETELRKHLGRTVAAPAGAD
ncbi:MAG: hypothetical protein HY683_10280 [Chloroflexi bacterium]|nr:hypothetical protein [Chloroflexota bacterium]